MPRTFALIPAAGKSTRMGRPKLALPLGERTVLQCVIATLRQAGIRDMLVVVGPHVSVLAELARAAGADVHLLEHETEDMRATVEEGLTWIARHWSPIEEDGWLLLPADHPTLDSAVVRALLEARQQSQDKSLFIPTYEGRRGHPTWIAWKHVAAIQGFPRGTGLNHFFRTRSDETQEVPVDSPSILWDLDTPADYEKLLAGIVSGSHFKVT